MPGDGTGGTTGTAGTGIDFAGALNLGGNTGSGANGSGNGASGNKPIVKDAGCACDIVGRSPAGGAAVFLGLVSAVAFGARRRRHAA
jgi:MYXO-CTERM domain-containing protein